MQQLTTEQFHAFVAGIKVPDGFTSEVQEGEPYSNGEPKPLVFVLTKADEIVIKFDQGGSGHTSYKAAGAWYTFDRRGVEDSFYHQPMFSTDKVKDPNAIVTEQMDRIAKQLEYKKTAVQIPGIPFTTSPAGIADLKARLTKNGSITFTPSGFGTGYVIYSKKPPARRYSQMRLAPPELNNFLGITPLWIDKFDAD